jgi:hypothetical protein
MQFTSILKKPSESVTVAIATGILIYSIYDRALPDAATMHATDANNINLDAARRKATITAAGALSGVTLITRDINVWILGSAILFALDFHARHANASNPDTGALVSDQGYGQLKPVPDTSAYAS